MMLSRKLPLVIGIELLLLMISIVIAKDISEIIVIDLMLTAFVLLGAASISFLKAINEASFNQSFLDLPHRRSTLIASTLNEGSV